MLKLSKKFKIILRSLLIILMVGVVSVSMIGNTFSATTTNEPNLIVTINENGSTTHSGNLFNGHLFPSTIEDAEKGIGSISGVIRIKNNFKRIEVNNLSIGLNSLAKNDGKNVDTSVVSSFLNNVNLKIEKGMLFNFDQALIDYTKLKDVLYKTESGQYNGYNLKTNSRFNLYKGDSIDLKYILQMNPEAGNELQSLTAIMPIYINLDEYRVIDEDNDDGEEVVIIDDLEIPVAKLNKGDHFQYIQGYPNNTVKPEGMITREEVAAVFYRLLDTNYRLSIISDIDYFKDVNTNRWSLKHIATLFNGNIINGYPDGNYKPKNPITRAELATIVSKFDKLSLTDTNKFTDVDGHWAVQYINSAAEKGWVKGYPDGTFKPDDYITRAEFVTLVNNVLERSVKKDHILKEARLFPDLSETMWYYEAMVEAINSHLYTRDKNLNETWIEIIYPQLDL